MWTGMPLYNENQMIVSASRQDICREDLRNSRGRCVYSIVRGNSMTIDQNIQTF
jgi:hypothetical protein